MSPQRYSGNSLNKKMKKDNRRLVILFGIEKRRFIKQNKSFGNKGRC